MLTRAILRHTPLFAIEAVAVDTETTGLDPRSARLLEVGAVVIRGSVLQEETAFRRLVASPEPIPAAATAVHGIENSDLVGAPRFTEVYAELVGFIGDRPVIGHAVGFDLAVLKRECALAAIPFRTWPALDIRLLAQVAVPDLAEFSLERLSAWFGMQATERHLALPDALLAARIFIGLVPVLRESGVRTVAEAEAACRSLSRVLENYYHAGWVEPGADLPELDRHGGSSRFDSYPYRRRVRDLMRCPPVFVCGAAAMRLALNVMTDNRISSVFVGDRAASAASLGIVTERDVLRTLRQRGAAALDEPVATIAARPLITVPEDAFVYRAIGRMRRFSIRHLAAVTEANQISGALSARDLLRWRADAAIVLGDDIDAAEDVAALARAWAKVPAMASSLLDEAVSARDIAGMIARELGAAVSRATKLAEQQIADEGLGASPCPYSVLILGSAGRGESLLALDQDHAIIFSGGHPDGMEDRWFEKLGMRIADILHTIGVPYCPGGVMAGNSAFRGSLNTWRSRISHWIDRAAPEDLLNVDIFFDFRPACGDGMLAAQLWNEAWKAAQASPPFLLLLTEAAQSHRAPISFLGRLKTEDGRIDLKRYGLWPIVRCARLLALRHGVPCHSTTERLDGVRALGIGGTDLAAAGKAHDRFLELILKAQLADLAAGQRASNRVPLKLIAADNGASRLRADLHIAASLYEVARDHLVATHR
jgi:DNA polymerase-3 subunit epsilon/CBS domain-containing protein